MREDPCRLPGPSALADLIPFCLHAGTMGTIKRVTRALVLGTSLMNVLLILLLSRPLSHQSQPAAGNGTDCGSHPWITRKAPPAAPSAAPPIAPNNAPPPDGPTC